ncbi:hypothetical protein Tco_0308480 [Tanacetum coccineum]
MSPLMTCSNHGGHSQQSSICALRSSGVLLIELTLIMLKGCGKNLLSLSTISRRQEESGTASSGKRRLSDYHSDPKNLFANTNDYLAGEEDGSDPDSPRTKPAKQPTKTNLAACLPKPKLHTKKPYPSTGPKPQRKSAMPLKPDTGKLQPLLEVPGKGKEKVVTRSLMKKCLRVVRICGFRRGQARPDPVKHNEHMDEGFTAAAYPEVQENLKLKVDEQVILEEPVSSTGTFYGGGLYHAVKEFNDSSSSCRFKDLLRSDMKEILLQRLSGGRTMTRDMITTERETKEGKVSKILQRIRLGLFLSPPPPPPPPSGAIRGFWLNRSLPMFAQALSFHLYSSSTHQQRSVTSTAGPSFSKTAVSAGILYLDNMNKILLVVMLVGRDHIPTASALNSTYAPPQENSLLAQTGDMAIFMDKDVARSRTSCSYLSETITRKTLYSEFATALVGGRRFEKASTVTEKDRYAREMYRLLYGKLSQTLDLLGLEVGWIRRIQVLDTAYWGFLGVGTTLDIFQNIILIPYFEYGVLSLSGYGVLGLFLCGLCSDHSNTAQDKVNASFIEVNTGLSMSNAAAYLVNTASMFFTTQRLLLIKCCPTKAILFVKVSAASLILRTVLMVDSNTFGQEMVNILVSGEANEKCYQMNIFHHHLTERYGSRLDSRIQVLDTAIGDSLSRDQTLGILPNILNNISSIRRIESLWIRRIDLYPYVVFGDCRRKYAVYSLMDTAYWSSE